jgi:hypothetical protein
LRPHFPGLEDEERDERPQRDVDRDDEQQQLEDRRDLEERTGYQKYRTAM